MLACSRVAFFPIVRAGGARRFATAAVADPAYRDDSIYTRDHAFDIFRRVTFKTDGLNANENKDLREHINTLFMKHRPSKHSFFATLRNAPSEVVHNSLLLREMYIRYQAAMHSTRVSVYFSPFLNTPALRQRKVKIIADDDTTDGVPSHHKQLENLFVALGARDVPGENQFGDIEELASRLDKDTARFVVKEDQLYRATLGAWTMVEVLSDDWISAFAKSFEPHYPEGFVVKQQYFDEIATGHVEIEHMLQTLALTEDSLVRYPHLLELNKKHASEMCEELDGLWTNLENLVKNPNKMHISMR